MNSNLHNQVIQNAIKAIGKLQPSCPEDSVLIENITENLSKLIIPASSKKIINYNSENIIAIKNGHTLTEAEIQNLDENSLAIILDLIQNRLWYRGDPENHSPFIKSPQNGLGSSRITILRHLLERPN